MKERMDRRLPFERVILRVFRTLGYLGLAGAGFMLAISADIFPLYYVLMGYWCLVGGVLSAYGAASGRWVGEYMGLPLLASAMTAFAALAFRDNGWQYGAPSVLILAGYGLILAGRWLTLSAIGRSARKAAHERN